MCIRDRDNGAWQFTFIDKNYKEDSISFEKFTRPIIEALKRENIDASFNSRNDLLINNKKFSGNAQYRKKMCIRDRKQVLMEVCKK